MRCVIEIRAVGVAPDPVADARQQAHKCWPKTRCPHQFPHQPKNARGVGQSPTGARKRAVFNLACLQQTN